MKEDSINAISSVHFCFKIKQIKLAWYIDKNNNYTEKAAYLKK